MNALVGLFFGSAGYYCALAYTASCAVVFMARTLSNLVPEQAAHGGKSEHRNHLLAGCVLLHVLTCHDNYYCCCCCLSQPCAVSCACVCVCVFGWQNQHSAAAADVVPRLQQRHVSSLSVNLLEYA